LFGELKAPFVGWKHDPTFGELLNQGKYQEAIEYLKDERAKRRRRQLGFLVFQFTLTASIGIDWVLKGNYNFFQVFMLSLMWALTCSYAREYSQYLNGTSSSDGLIRDAENLLGLANTIKSVRGGSNPSYLKLLD